MSAVGSVYGQALYDLALEEHTESTILEELKILSRSFSCEPDFLKLLSLSNLSKQERCDILDDCFRGKIHSYLLNFLKLLTEKGYVRHFEECVKSYESCYNEDSGILPVTAVTTVPLTKAQAAKLSEKMAKITGKRIDLTNRVDPSCIGGVRLDYNGKRLDDTVFHRMEALGRLLKNTVL